MPSPYAPFESVHEFYLKGGAPAIARAAGGLAQQVAPLRATGCYHGAVEARCGPWHVPSAPSTGLLFREPDKFGAAEHWRHYHSVCSGNGGSQTGLDARLGNPLFRSLRHELETAIGDAVRVHDSAPTLYHQMVVRGIELLTTTFGWERNAREVARLLVP